MNRILIVDDELNMRLVLAAMLKKEGYEVTAAADGAEAREINPMSPRYRLQVALWKKLPLPVANLLGPLIVWLVKKDTMPFVADQGKEALNFNITLLIASIVLILVTVFTLFIAAFITIPLGILLGIAWLVLTIIAGIKANEGQPYRYPFSWRLLK